MTDVEILNFLREKLPDLVRCKDCRKYTTQACAVKHEQALNDYCSHGERKDARDQGGTE